MKKVNFYIVFLFVVLNMSAQNINKIEPPYWWVGMNNNQLELMIYGENIAQYTPSINNLAIDLVNVKRTENSNYIFLNLNLSKAEVGKCVFDFSKSEEEIATFCIDYELKLFYCFLTFQFLC